MPNGLLNEPIGAVEEDVSFQSLQKVVRPRLLQALVESDSCLFNLISISAASAPVGKSIIPSVESHSVDGY